MKNRKTKRPSFETAVQLAIGLELSKDEAIDFISRAGLAFKPCDERDQYLLELIEKKIGDVQDVNDALFFEKFDTLTDPDDNSRTEKKKEN